VIVSEYDIDSSARTEIDFSIGRAYGATGDWESAITALSDGIGFDPYAADLLVYRADAYYRIGEKAKAKADYERALELIPDYGPAVAGLEQIAGDQEKPEP